MTPKENRQAVAASWIESATGCSDVTLTPLSGDASFRRYYRVRCDERNYMLMDAPPDKEEPATFSRITELLEQHQIRVPHIHHADLEHGFLLIDDFGDRLYLNEVSETNADELYHKAIDTLLDIQKTEIAGLPQFTSELLLDEMHLFTDWYCGQHLQITLNATQSEIMEQAFSKLIDNAAAQPQTFVHRDYHSRNLLITGPHQEIGVLDYQDAVYGPLTYDLVSLLKDCYIRWPQQRIESWMNYFLELYRKSSRTDFSDAQFSCWFDLMGVQRHLKASGIFARLLHRDGKTGYIKEIPRVLNYITDCLAEYPDYSDFHGILLELPTAQ